MTAVSSTVCACICFATATAFAGQLPLSAADPIPAAELEAFVDGVVRHTMVTNHIAGAAVSIVQDGRVVLNKGYGFADVQGGRRVDPDTTLFRIGSITKTFTWILMMNAVEAGRLSLDDPVNRHLPADLRIPDEGFSRPILIRHLLQHSPGFEDRMFGHLFETDARQVRSLAEYLREERPRRVRDAGELSSYSNYGVGLAGAALEQIAGRPWQEQVEADVLRPLGMRHTSVREPYPARDGLPAPMPVALSREVSKGYRWEGVQFREQPFEFISHGAPAGAISSSAGDMARYMLTLLGGGSLDGVRVFGPAAAQAFRTPMTPWPAEVGSWNAGLLELPLAGTFRAVGHDGGSLLFFSTMALVPELRLGIFVSTNTAGGDSLSGPLPARIVERFYGEPSRPARAGSAAVAAAAASFDGYYLQTRRAYSGLEGFIFRLLARRVRVTSDGYVIAPLFGPAVRLAPGRHPDVLYAADGEGLAPAVLVYKQEDRVVRLDTPFMAFERLPFVMQPPTLIVPGVLAILLSIGTLLRLRGPSGGQARQAPVERRAAALQVAAAIAWLMSGGGLAVFAMSAGTDESIVFAGWPPLSLMVFSTAALVATILSAAMLALLVQVWRSRQPGWTTWRRSRHTGVAAVFGILGALLAWWGALQPWAV